ncbi:lytic transglycosylase domain-containing protein [Nonomuraea sp. NPDC005501]|uniref:aggregation-promoting factor C-terminal-like domain-containing protein n=1 Tax=Nonomuraea sp. NPDC005501 TaxID=3156884 RepID=UPI0033A4ACE7
MTATAVALGTTATPAVAAPSATEPATGAGSHAQAHQWRADTRAVQWRADTRAVQWRADTRAVQRRAATPVVHQGSWHAPVIRLRTWTPSVKSGLATRLLNGRQAADLRPQRRNKVIALDQVVRRSWSYQEFQCLDSLWTRESNWNHRAYNSSSGAYGIPQALPGGKMSGAGADWRSNPETQIRWGLAYIKGRYGRPCGAWGHFRSHNWY